MLVQTVVKSDPIKWLKSKTKGITNLLVQVPFIQAITRHYLKLFIPPFCFTKIKFVIQTFKKKKIGNTQWQETEEELPKIWQKWLQPRDWRWLSGRRWELDAAAMEHGTEQQRNSSGAGCERWRSSSGAGRERRRSSSGEGREAATQQQWPGGAGRRAAMQRRLSLAWRKKVGAATKLSLRQWQGGGAAGRSKEEDE